MADENPHWSVVSVNGVSTVVDHAQRHRVLKAGSIMFGGATIDCVVRNQFATGAALEIASPIGIPDEFTLVIAAANVRRRCIVLWRKTKTDWGGVLEAP
jgi:hypothetical protein